MDNEETAVDFAAYEQELIAGVEKDALFAAELEPVRLEVPGWEGCWFVLRKMDGNAAAGLDTAGMDREKYLVCNTVTDFCLKKKQKVAGGEGHTYSECRSDAVQAKLRKQFIREQLCGDTARDIPGLAPGLWRWLVYNCLQVNGLLPQQEKN